MWSLLHALPPDWFWFFLVATLIVLALFQWIDKPLKTGAAPLGIVSFELAGSVAKAQEILASWDPRARVYAGFSLGFDYLFMPLYAITISLACLWGATVLPPLAWLGWALAWGVWIAAVCDGIENYALWKILVAGAEAPWPRIAQRSALIKFVLIGLGLVYIATMGVVWLLRK